MSVVFLLAKEDSLNLKGASNLALFFYLKEARFSLNLGGDCFICVLHCFQAIDEALYSCG